MVSGNRILAIIMAGGRGERLGVLTKYRGKPGESIVGEYRIIDFAATNVANSSVYSLMVITQSTPRSLNTHMGDGSIWGFGGDKPFNIIGPYVEGKKKIDFAGTADCVRKNWGNIERLPLEPSLVLILGGDHVYSTSYDKLIEDHVNKSSDATVMVQGVLEDKVKDFGILRVDANGQITEFAEKPDPTTSEGADIIEKFRLDDSVRSTLKITDPNVTHVASMGNYVFNKDVLKVVMGYKGNDFGKNIIPFMIDKHKVNAFNFDGYWRDVGKIPDYFECNMDFVRGPAPIDLIRNPIKTAIRCLPSTQVLGNGNVMKSIISPGSQIYGVVNESVLGYQVVVEDGATLDQCILFGADRNVFENGEIQKTFTTRIGRDSVLEQVILDRNVQIGRGVYLGPKSGNYGTRKRALMAAGLKEYDGNTLEGDFTLDRETGILVIGKQFGTKAIIPDGFGKNKK